MSELIKISPESAKAQIERYFDYYSESIDDIAEYQEANGAIGMRTILKKVQRLIEKGIVSIEVSGSGVEIIQKLHHGKKLSELRYAALSGEAAMAISEIGDDMLLRCTLLGKLSGAGAEQIKGLVGADWKNAATLHAFLSLF
jgi:hypothetical protein